MQIFYKNDGLWHPKYSLNISLFTSFIINNCCSRRDFDGDILCLDIFIGMGVSNIAGSGAGTLSRFFVRNILHF